MLVELLVPVPIDHVLLPGLHSRNLRTKLVNLGCTARRLVESSLDGDELGLGVLEV